MIPRRKKESPTKVGFLFWARMTGSFLVLVGGAALLLCLAPWRTEVDTTPVWLALESTASDTTTEPAAFSLQDTLFSTEPVQETEAVESESNPVAAPAAQETQTLVTQVAETSPAQESTIEATIIGVQEAEEESDSVVSYPLNLNTATVEELETLPSIGTTLAQRIVTYRDTIGGFSSRSELLSINGIGDRIYAQIAPYLFIEGETDVLSDTATASASAAGTDTIPTLDINLATEAEFLQLPDMTPEIARNIVQLRTTIQYFQNVYELLYVNGMTDKLFLEIRDYLYVGGV
jgi:competence protein ComEA